MGTRQSGSSSSLFKSSVYIGFLTMLFDFLFHTFLTTPEETLAYFVAKFVFAFLAAMLISLIVRPKYWFALIGALTFDMFSGIYYSVAYYLDNSVLSCCFTTAPQVWGVMNVIFFHIYDVQIDTNLLIFALLVHPLAFFGAALIVRGLKH